MPDIDWIIHIVANGVRCEACGKAEDCFPQYFRCRKYLEESNMTREELWQSSSPCCRISPD